MITVFQSDPAGRRSGEFWEWLQAHPQAYYINLNGPASGRIHRADCPHMKFPRPDRVNFLSRGKLCSAERAELRREAERLGVALEECPDCDRLDSRLSGRGTSNR